MRVKGKESRRFLIRKGFLLFLRLFAAPSERPLNIQDSKET